MLVGLLHEQASSMGLAVHRDVRKAVFPRLDLEPAARGCAR
jgi:hypothetical protein